MATKRNTRAPCSQKVVSRHEELIRSLVASDPDIHRNGFKSAIRELVAEVADDPDEMGEPNFLPDAYKIDRESETIIIYEVETTNPLSTNKMSRLGWFWFEWDQDGTHEWLPELRLVDRYGNVVPMNLAEFYYGVTLAQASGYAPTLPVVSPSSRDGAGL